MCFCQTTWSVVDFRSLPVCDDVTSGSHDVTSGLPRSHVGRAGLEPKLNSVPDLKIPFLRGQVTWAKYGLLIGPNLKSCNLIG